MSNVKKFRIVKFKSKPILAAKNISKSFGSRIILRKIDMHLNTGEMLGYDAVYDCIKANGNQSAEEQKQSLLDLGSAWLGDLQNQDDITIVVVKKSKPLE